MAKRDLLWRSGCFAILWLLAAQQTGRAQTLYGSIIGNVKDSSDAVVAGATVTLINIETKQSRETGTNDGGGYDFPTVSPGTYEVRVSKGGFTTFVETSVMA